MWKKVIDNKFVDYDGNGIEINGEKIENPTDEQLMKNGWRKYIFEKVHVETVDPKEYFKNLVTINIPEIKL